MEFKDETLCVKVEPDSKCHADLGDGRMSWESNGYFRIVRNEENFIVVGRTLLGIDGLPTGNHQEVPYEELIKWQKIYGIDSIIPISLLPKEIETSISYE